MLNNLSPSLVELRRQFIVPNSAVVGMMSPRHRVGFFVHYYCPYAPCCSDCKGIFTFRELLGHLRRTHQHGSVKIKALVSKGLPRVPDKTA